MFQQHESHIVEPAKITDMTHRQYLQ